jgi:hypothetical protein
MRGAGAVAQALRRTAESADRTTPLSSARDRLAVLTCSRLDELRFPRRGDGPLTGVLAALHRAPSGELPASGVARESGRGTRSVSTDQPRRAVRPAARPAASSPPPVRPPSRAIALQPGPDATILDAAGGVRASPGEAAAQVRGLEWVAQSAREFTDAAPAPLLAEAALTPLQPTSAEAETTSSVQRPGQRPAATPIPRRPELPSPVGTPEVPADTLPTPATPPLRAAGEADEPTLAATPDESGQLARLVRAWERSTVPPSSSEAWETGRPARASSALLGEDEALAVLTRRRAPEAALTAQPDPSVDLLGLGDAVGRALVDELRRYGIEVTPG